LLVNSKAYTVVAAIAPGAVMASGAKVVLGPEAVIDGILPLKSY